MLLFFNCILKSNNQLIEDAQDLDIVMPMSNLLYSSKNFRKTIRSTKLINILADNLPTIPPSARSEDIKIVVPLKNLSNFIFNLDFLMINTEIELILKWSPNCVLTEKAEREGKAREVGPPALNLVNLISIPSDLKFSITDCKLYIPVVTLQEKYENELYKNLKTGINFDFEWGRYRTLQY